MDSSGQGSSGSGGSSPWYGNALTGPHGSHGRKREREESVDFQYLGARGEPEAKSQKTTPSPVPSARELYMVESRRSPFNRELLPAGHSEGSQLVLVISILFFCCFSPPLLLLHYRRVVARLLTGVRDFGLSRFQTNIAAAEQDKEVDAIFGNNTHPSQVLRPTQSQVVPQLQRWASRGSYEDRFVAQSELILLFS